MSMVLNELGIETAIVTGAGGFLGRHLVPRLLMKGMRVIAVTSRSRAELLRICHPAVGADDSRLKVVSSACRDDLAWVLRGAGVVVNCAFPRNTNGRQLADGMRFIGRLFEACAREGVGAVINVSSQSVYDQHRTICVTEDEPLCLESTYAVAKYATELLLGSSCNALAHTSVRLASLIGPGFDQRVVNKMVLRAVQGEELCVSDGTSRFGYLDCADAADGIVSLLDVNPRDWHEVYNLGPRETYSVHDIARSVARVLARRGIAVRVVERERAFESLFTGLSSQLITEATGWRPQVTLEETIESIAREVLGDCPGGAGETGD